MKNFYENELDLYKGVINKEGILNVLKVVLSQEHSGFSIGFITSSISNRVKIEEIEERLAKSEDDYSLLVNKSILEVLKSIEENKLTENEKDLLCKLIDNKPISNLTFEDNEWNQIGDNKYQNKRCSAVFKDEDNRPYYLNAIIKRVKRPDGKYSHWNGSMIIEETGERIRSFGYIKNPNFIETIIVDVREEEIAPDDWEMYVSIKELEKVKEHYDLMYI